MARAPKFLSSLENSLEKVGPGTYSPEKLYTNLKPSIKGRHNIRFKTDAPGPAEYISTFNLDTIPKLAMESNNIHLVTQEEG